jgi:hypothetical protein
MADILESIFGSKPEVAPYMPTDLTAEQIAAIMANISAFPDISQLGDLYQTYMTQAFNEAIPGFSDILASGGRVTKEMLAQAEPLLQGQIPEDVKAQVLRSAAYKSLESGTAGSPMAGALTARDLGRTSLDMIMQGEQLAGAAGNAAQRWAGLASGLIMNPQGMMITPQQLAQFTMQNRLLEQATKQFGYNVAAAPNPVFKGLSDLVASETAAYLGGMGGGRMGGGGMGGGAGGTVSPPYQNFGYAPYDTSGGWGSNINQGMGYGGGSVSGGGYNFGGY